MRAFSVNENIHPIWGEDFFFYSLPTLFGSGYLNYNHPMYDIFIKKGQQKRGKEYGTDGYSEAAA